MKTTKILKKNVSNDNAIEPKKETPVVAVVKKPAENKGITKPKNMFDDNGNYTAVGMFYDWYQRQKRAFLNQEYLYIKLKLGSEAYLFTDHEVKFIEDHFDMFALEEFNILRSDKTTDLEKLKANIKQLQEQGIEIPESEMNKIENGETKPLSGKRSIHEVMIDVHIVADIVLENLMSISFEGINK